jgi:hypothetical protein
MPAFTRVGRGQDHAFATRWLVVLAASALLPACSQTATSRANPTAPSALSAAASEEGAPATAPASPIRGASWGPSIVVFPPRDQAFVFRQDLEAYYRDVFRRSANQSFVDIEGTIVWTQEYLRYRVNSCGHTEAVNRVMAQIDGSSNTATCSTAETPFPPRNEPLAFRVALEAKYRDGLRRSPSTTFVDIEGDIVWTQEYLRYRTTGCDHNAASARVREQLEGRPPAAGCAPPPVVPPTAVPLMRQNGNITEACNLQGTTTTTCSLDGSSSTGAIDSYQWTTVRFRNAAAGGTLTENYSGRTVNLSLPCSSQGNTQERFDVTLRVSGPGGDDTETRTLSLARAGCGT